MINPLESNINSRVNPPENNINSRVNPPESIINTTENNINSSVNPPEKAKIKPRNHWEKARNQDCYQGSKSSFLLIAWHRDYFHNVFIDLLLSRLVDSILVKSK